MPITRSLLPALVVLGLLLSGCKKNQTGPVDPAVPAPGSGAIATGPAVEAGSLSIGPAGGTLVIAKPGTPVDGMRIEVPANAYPEMRTYQVSYAPVQGHQFGPKFNPASPLITIANGGGYTDLPMTVRIPVKVPAGRFAMAFLYDASTGQLEGMPLLARDSTSVTIASTHFDASAGAAASGFGKLLGGAAPGAGGQAQIVVSSIEELELVGIYDTEFRPGVDDWGFPNYGSYLASGGHCAGQSVGAIWYYTQKRSKGSPPLWMRFDNDGDPLKTPKLWQDDVLGYKFCSVLQDDGSWANLGNVLGLILQSTPLGDASTFDAVAYALLITKRPQLLAIYRRDGFSIAGHAVIIYGLANNQLYVCDPNFPGQLDRRIVFNTLLFSPYSSGPNAKDTNQAYNHFYYMGLGSLVDFHSIDDRWREVAGKTIGQGKFPSYTTMVLNEQVEFEELKDGFTKANGDFSLSVRGSGFLGRFEVFDSTGKSLALDSPFHLRKGNHRIGIAAYDRNGTWVGFQWYRLVSNAEGLILPLALDNEWTYTETGYDATGKTVATHTRKRNVIGFKTIGGDRYGVVNEQIDTDQPSTAYYLNKSDGLWGGDDNVSPRLIYRFPAVAGEGYPLGTGVSITVDSVGRTRTVPAGTFDNCIVYTIRYAGYTLVTERTFAVDVGEIQKREFDKAPSGAMYLFYDSRLATFTLK